VGGSTRPPAPDSDGRERHRRGWAPWPMRGPPGDLRADDQREVIDDLLTIQAAIPCPAGPEVEVRSSEPNRRAGRAGPAVAHGDRLLSDGDLAAGGDRRRAVLRRPGLGPWQAALGIR